MRNRKYWLGFLFILILFIPFRVGGEELTERVIINFYHEIDENLLKDPKIEVHHLFEDYKAASVTIPVSIRKDLQTTSSIRYIENDPVVQTTVQTMNWGYQKLAIDGASKTGLTGNNIKIGILDTGVNIHHPDLRLSGGVSLVKGQASYDDDNGHGTHVAGIIAAKDNDYGIVGIVPEAEIFAIKVLDHAGKGNQSDIVAGIQWAIDQRLDILNLSVTSSAHSFLLQEVLQDAYEQGIFVVAASGNMSAKISITDVQYPARYPTVIAVGSINQNEERSDFSYYGSNLDFVAPGESILSTYIPDGEYGWMTGTSMAVPFVTGMVALYKQEYPTLDYIRLLGVMQHSAKDLGDPGKDIYFGYGLIQGPAYSSIFPDVVGDNWYREGINELYKGKIVDGYPDGKFHPTNNVTRSEAVTMLGRARKWPGEQTSTIFSDVLSVDYSSGYIKSATERGIVLGYPDGKFHPNSFITRGDVALILQETFDYPFVTEYYFPDVRNTNYYDNAINSLASKGIIEGYPDGTFKPDQPISRAEFSKLLSKALQE